MAMVSFDVRHLPSVEDLDATSLWSLVRWDTSAARSMPDTANDMATGGKPWKGSPLRLEITEVMVYVWVIHG